MTTDLALKTRDEYDFSREIKFSKAGYDSFIIRLGLALESRMPDKYEVWTDHNENFFYFAIVNCPKTAPELHAVLLPDRSQVKL